MRSNTEAHIGATLRDYLHGFNKKAALSLPMRSALTHMGSGAALGSLSGGLGGALHAGEGQRSEGALRGALTGGVVGGLGGLGVHGLKQQGLAGLNAARDVAHHEMAALQGASAAELQRIEQTAQQNLAHAEATGASAVDNAKREFSDAALREVRNRELEAAAKARALHEQQQSAWGPLPGAAPVEAAPAVSGMPTRGPARDLVPQDTTSKVGFELPNLRQFLVKRADNVTAVTKALRQAAPQALEQGAREAAAFAPTILREAPAALHAAPAMAEAAAHVPPSATDAIRAYVQSPEAHGFKRTLSPADDVSRIQITGHEGVYREARPSEFWSAYRDALGPVLPEQPAVMSAAAPKPVSWNVLDAQRTSAGAQSAAYGNLEGALEAQQARGLNALGEQHTQNISALRDQQARHLENVRAQHADAAANLGAQHQSNIARLSEQQARASRNLTLGGIGAGVLGTAGMGAVATMQPEQKTGSAHSTARAGTRDALREHGLFTAKRASAALAAGPKVANETHAERLERYLDDAGIAALAAPPVMSLVGEGLSHVPYAPVRALGTGLHSLSDSLKHSRLHELAALAVLSPTIARTIAEKVSPSAENPV